MNTQTATFILAALAVAGQVFLAGLLLLWLASFFNAAAKQALKRLAVFMRDKDTSAGFLVAVIAMTGSLFYSEVAKFTPCLMCWYQRIAMYPFVALFGVELFKKQHAIRDHALVLATIGVLLASYHYLLQVGVITASSCDITGYSVSCSQVFTMTFGYITIPLMALTAFALIIAFTLLGKAGEKFSSERKN